MEIFYHNDLCRITQTYVKNKRQDKNDFFFIYKAFLIKQVFVKKVFKDTRQVCRRGRGHTCNLFYISIMKFIQIFWGGGVIMNLPYII